MPRGVRRILFQSDIEMLKMYALRLYMSRSHLTIVILFSRKFNQSPLKYP